MPPKSLLRMWERPPPVGRWASVERPSIDDVIRRETHRVFALHEDSLGHSTRPNAAGFSISCIHRDSLTRRPPLFMRHSQSFASTVCTRSVMERSTMVPWLR